MQNDLYVAELRALAQRDLRVLNELRCENSLCVRQDIRQQRIIERLKSRFIQLKLLDIDNATEYDQKVAILEAYPRQEKPHLKRVA